MARGRHRGAADGTPGEDPAAAPRAALPPAPAGRPAGSNRGPTANQATVGDQPPGGQGSGKAARGPGRPLVGGADGGRDGGTNGGARTGTPRRGGFVLLRNWRVRSKLIAVLVVPAVAFLVVAGINLNTSVSNARGFGQGAKLADFGRQVTGLVHGLQGERDLTNGYLGALASGRTGPGMSGGTQPSCYSASCVVTQLAAEQRVVDGQLASYRAAESVLLSGVSGETQHKLNTAHGALDAIGSLRTAARNRLLTQGAIVGQYNSTIGNLLDIDLEIGLRSGSRDLAQSVTALDDLSRAKEASSQVRGALYSTSFTGSFEFGGFQQLSTVLAVQDAALSRFRVDATDQQRALFDGTVTGQANLAVKRIQDSAANRQQATDLNIYPEQWYLASSTKLESMRSVESGLLDSVIFTANTLKSDAQRSAVTTGLVVLAIMLVALLTSLMIARSMIRPLRKLRTSALDVAEQKLPAAIERLRSPDGGDIAEIPVEPIDVDSRDEIGEVARTFDAIHREAIRLATEQAALRSNVNSMFVNLSRRSQSLVERQLKLIDELETGEQDPDQLANLFKLDHLATRMRRNSENLLVLAGEDAGRRWGRPIPLVDVLRAGTSEVEQYHRIQLTGVPDVEVMGHAVNHVVHLVAELLENATVFSSPESKVLVHSQRLSDGGAMVEIEDRGIGMTAQEIADANDRLARPPVFDVSISRMMGLFVVGRLAGRHDITVRLRQSEMGGVSAFVRLPADVLANRFDQRSEPAGLDGGRPRSAAQPLPPPSQPVPSRGLIGDLPRRALPAPGALPEQPALPPAALALPPAASALPPGMPRQLPPQPLPPQPGMPGVAPLPRRTPASARGAAGSNGIPNGPVDGTPAGFSQPALPSPAGPPARPAPAVVPRLGGSGPHSGGPYNGASGSGGQPPSAVRGAPGQPLGPLGATPPASREERTPIFEQLQSEWFRRRPPVRPPISPSEPAAGLPPGSGPVPTGPRPADSGAAVSIPAGARPSGPTPIAAGPAGAGATGAGPAWPGPVGQVPGGPVPAGQPAAGPAGTPTDPAWQSPADEGWRAAERLLAPTIAGTTRAGLPMRVPQANLVPGAADSAPTPPPPAAPPAYRSPEAVRSRLASYHQGVRRGRHADRRGENHGDRDPSEVLVQSQEQS